MYKNVLEAVLLKASPVTKELVSLSNLWRELLSLVISPLKAKMQKTKLVIKYYKIYLYSNKDPSVNPTAINWRLSWTHNVLA